MKKTTKRILGLVLAMTMILALAACGTKNPAASGTPSTPATSTPATPGTSTPATPSTSTPAEPAEPDKISIGIATDTNVADYENNDFTHWLEEHANVEIEFVYMDKSNYATQLTAMVAGNEELPDMLYDMPMSAEEVYVYGSDGYFLDLTDFFYGEPGKAYRERFAYLFGEDAMDTYMKDITSPDGGIYVFPYVGPSSTETPRMTYINQVWLDKLGLEVPTTYDELVTVLRAFKTQDPNGNGKADELPMVGRINSKQSDISLWLINNWEFIVYDMYGLSVKDGDVYSPYTTDAYREALKALNDLVDEGLLTDLSWTFQSGSELRAVLDPADGVALSGVFSCHAVNAFNTDSDMIYEYTELPPFNYAPLKSAHLDFSACYSMITEDAENPEACFRLMTTMATLDGYAAGKWGVEGRDWEWVKDDAGNIIGYTKLETAENLDQGTTVAWFQTPHCTLLNEAVEPAVLAALPADPADWTWSNYRTNMTREHAEAYRAQAEKNNPTEMYDWTPAYTDEESDELGTIQTDITTYVTSKRAEFATGVLDPYSDADWNNYVKDIENLGLATWLKLGQAAYDRYLGK